MKAIAIDEQSRVNLLFNEYGQPIGEASVGLASFLGPLVREVVPVNLENWKKLPTKLKIVLWKSIQSRYNVNDDWQKQYFFQKMGRLWRAGKSRMVNNIRKAPTKDALLKLMPDNFQTADDWMDFVNEKTSPNFVVKSEKYKAMKKKQLPHTCSRKGYARLAEEMKKSFSDPTSITKVMLWTKAQKKRWTTSECTSCRDTRGRVAEGWWSSNDPAALVHHIPLGQHAVRVWVDISKKLNAYLWRPTSEMTCIEEAVGSTVAWPSDKVTIGE